MTPQEWADRQSIWSILSELYLDVELTTFDYHRIAIEIIRLGYKLNEAKGIDYYEVVPAVGLNILLWHIRRQCWTNLAQAIKKVSATE
ncbi:hypothetical protein SAMN04488029_2454 [Reichenbachiella faecimaris]|uniref:DUF7079 domain-containing protein n=1 Tax=Reichenbachiella faecimaris TaxID=692418 RepID=A0A1W2GGB6_REIFA|nr:hypothetical protein [Reichenbachiella faecimaris]SMD35326.1 hypothetical protein SAMN04488029_2454 [Reichenbachiella faecimaris]